MFAVFFLHVCQGENEAACQVGAIPTCPECILKNMREGFWKGLNVRNL